jgi:flagellar motor switch protein FliN
MAKDEFGGFSQADIDALLNDGAKGGSASPPPPAPDEAELSQDEIDAAFGRQQAAAPPATPQDTRVDAAGNPYDEAASEMAAIIEEEKRKAAAAPKRAETPAPPVGPLEMPDFTPLTHDQVKDQQINLLEDVELNVKIELGRTRMLVEDVLRLGEGSVVELDKLAGDPVDVLVNDRLVARGEVLVLNDNFCVRVNEIISQTGAAIRG